MELMRLEYDLTVCKVEAITDIDMTTDFFFVGKTDDEISLIGILSKLSGILAENNIGIFAVSTFNTDYILVKTENFERALSILSEEGYTVL